jgi:hypothetical protein
MTLTREALASILTKAQAKYDSGLHLWKGASFDNATEVFNADGTRPWVNQTNVVDSNLIIDPTYRVSDEVYNVAFPTIDNDDLDDYLKDTFWITTFGGNPKRVKPTPKELKSQGSYWLVRFIHRVDN